MALYEIVLDALYFNQQVINRFNFSSSGVPASVLGSFGLVSAMGFIADAGSYPTGTYFDAIRRVQNNQMVYQQVVCKNIYEPTDFYALPFVTPVMGTHEAGHPMSPAIAWGLRSNQVRLDIGRGFKRFAGGSEEDVDAGGAVGATMTALLVEMCTIFNAPITYDDEGNTITYNQVVVGKQKYTPDPAKPDKFAYRYYATFTEQSSHLASGIQWQPYNRVRTQTSRQYGKGS